MDFFDKMGEAISNASLHVSNKAKDFAETTKLYNQIHHYEDLIQKTYLALGKAYFEEHKHNTEDVQESKIRGILESEERIRNLRDEIQRIKGVVTCQNCGGEVEKTNQYCPFCGNKLS
ncbi:MAG: hydrogenase maturation nickel metallochaperone HypA [Clostridiales bacterium]|nr:hydrogenase maturation nickel metallochaperone HypA [Clostridiales bacterium]